MAKADEKKYAIFQKYNENLSKVLNQKVDFILCPICLDKFYIDDIKNKVLTLEDVPQKSLGGKKILLTCKTCNNIAGTKYENDLKLFVNQRIGSKSRYIAKFKDRIINGDYNQHTNEIELSPKNNDPKLLSEFVKSEVYSAKFDPIETFRYEKLNKAIIKAGYLYLYYLTGYNIILNDCYNNIRKIIKEEQEITETFNFYTTLKKPIDLPEGIFFYLSEPVYLKGILTNLKLTLDGKKYEIQTIVHFPDIVPQNYSTNKLILSNEKYDFFKDKFKHL